MQYLKGSAVKIISAPDPDPTEGTTSIVEQIIDPEGTVVESNEAMTNETVSGSVRSFFVWQSALTNVVGRYTYVTKATNGIFSDREKGFFYLEEV